MTIIVLVGCSNGSNGSSDVIVTVKIDELILMQNSGCFDNLGTIDATAYIFNRTKNNPDNLFEVDDIDGIAPEPFETISVTEKKGNGYVFSIAFKDEGAYSVAINCEASLDDPAIDNREFFFQKASIRIGDINDVTVETGIPSLHINTLNDCFGCHTLGPSYDYSVVNHDYVIGICGDCHS